MNSAQKLLLQTHILLLENQVEIMRTLRRLLVKLPESDGVVEEEYKTFLAQQISRSVKFKETALVQAGK